MWDDFFPGELGLKRAMAMAMTMGAGPPAAGLGVWG